MPLDTSVISLKEMPNTRGARIGWPGLCNISVLTLFPDLYKSFITTSLIGRACERGQLNIVVQDFFAFCAPKERLDSPTYGPGAGMVLKPLIVEQAIQAQEKQHGAAYKIFFSPHGKKLDQQRVCELARILQEKKHVMFVCARYEGMDARIEEEFADEIISIGDYVLMGGDLPAMVVLESILRYIPGIVGKDESVRCDSFSGPLVDHPEYTDPLEWHGKKVPDIVRSGNHAAIAQWRREQAIKRTVLDHFDWFRAHNPDKKLVQEAKQLIPVHYVALMHDEVNLKEGRVGTSSVTTFDIHDIARSMLTYGLEKYFVVTPLEDQKIIVQTLLDFWLEGPGKEYNPHRHESIKRVQLAQKLDEVVEAIEKETGRKPLLVATSAREHSGREKLISYNDQGIVWAHERPVLFLLGTAGGLSEQVITRCDYLLPPIFGLSDFNHLSVRSAAAVIFDRWLGIQ